MCGIVAMYAENHDVSPERLERATASLHHRGPDARQTWLQGARRVGLGHARLSIIDLEGGTQPLTNEDESLHAVVNGELYDFERIRADLEAKGHRFRTHCDSEIILHLYEEYGTGLVEHLRGEFAFVLYDAKSDLLIAGRDRFGIKPLVYGRINGVLTLASEAKALLAAGHPAIWDSETFFTSTYIAGPLHDRTFFAGISQVPPAHLLVATRSSTRLVPYWDFDYPSTAVTPRDEDEDRLELTHSLEEAVRLRLRADVPVGCYLSGGIDSCTVLGIASRMVRKPIRAFTLAFGHGEYDEEPIAREMASHAGADYTPIPVDQRDFAHDFVGALWHAERPINNSNSVAKFRLSRAVREAGIKVVLTGEGSDEVFAGYPHYRRDLFLQRARVDPAWAQRHLADLEKNNTVSNFMLAADDAPPMTAVKRALGGVSPTWLEAFASNTQKMALLVPPDWAARTEFSDPLSHLMTSLDVSRQLAGRHAVHQSMYLWSKTMLPNFILSVLGDRMEMAHSVEGRVPFLDHKVVELSARLPIDRLIRGSIEKYLLREVAKPFITERVYRRQKHPFVAPPVTTALQGPLFDLMQTTLRGPGAKEVPFFDGRGLAGLLDALPQLPEAQRSALDSAMMIVLSTVLIQQRFGITGAS